MLLYLGMLYNTSATDRLISRYCCFIVNNAGFEVLTLTYWLKYQNSLFLLQKRRELSVSAPPPPPTQYNI